VSIGPVNWMWAALTPLTPPPPPGPPSPARPVPPRNTWPRHATGTRRAHQWEIDRLVDGVMEYESPAHAPRFPYRLGIHGTVWRFRLYFQKRKLVSLKAWFQLKFVRFMTITESCRISGLINLSLISRLLQKALPWLPCIVWSNEARNLWLYENENDYFVYYMQLSKYSNYTVFGNSVDDKSLDEFMCVLT